MTWIDDIRDKVDRKQIKIIEQAISIFNRFSPVVMKLLSEVGDSLFSKNGIFSNKKYYTIDFAYHKGPGLYGQWVFKADPPYRIGLTVHLDIQLFEEAKGERYLALVAKCSVIYDNYHKIDISDEEHAETEIRDYLRRVVTRYLERYP